MQSSTISFMKTVATHNNRFHPDDVFAVATLQIVFGKEQINIVRTRDEEKINQADIVVDVGMFYDAEVNRFDHHQPDAPVRDNSIPYAAFGLVWHAYGEVITTSYVTEKIEERLVLPIDAGDNGISLYNVKDGLVPPAELFAVITSYVPLGEVTEKEYDSAFSEAVDFAREYLLRIIKFYEYQQEEAVKAKALYEGANDKRILVSDKSISAQLFSDFEDVQVVVSPKQSEDELVWRATTVSEAGEAFERRVAFPETWGGLRDGGLEEASGIEGAKFCHRGLFLFVARDKAGAIKAAEAAVEYLVSGTGLEPVTSTMSM